MLSDWVCDFAILIFYSIKSPYYFFFPRSMPANLTDNRGDNNHRMAVYWLDFLLCALIMFVVSFLGLIKVEFVIVLFLLLTECLSLACNSCISKCSECLERNSTNFFSQLMEKFSILGNTLFCVLAERQTRRLMQLSYLLGKYGAGGSRA